MTEKLQKVLAKQGLGSRRTMERWIEAGRITLDGKIATLGARVDEQTKIAVDGQLLKLTTTTAAQPAVLIYHKPIGEVCTRHDPEGRSTVFEHLPEPPVGRWVMIGRLDYNTSGLLLFTNDGELANHLMHPKFHLTRVYAVRIFGRVEPASLEKLQSGITLEDGEARFDSLQYMGGEGRNQWYEVSVSMGRNRIVRRLWESLGIKVNRLIRIRFGQIALPRDLLPGQYQFLTSQVVNSLIKGLKL